MKTDTRDRLTALLATSDFKSLDELLQHLMDEDLRHSLIQDWDRFREEDPQGWALYLQNGDELPEEQDGLYVWGDTP